MEQEQDKLQNTRLQAALQYRQWGLSVIPIIPGGDKKPYVKWGDFQQYKAYEPDLKTWWKDWPNADIAMVTGRISGLTVIDCDDQRAVDWIEARIPQGLSIPIQKTPSGFRHYFFLYNSRLKSGKKKVGNTVLEIKNDGCYVVINPSTGYEWITPLTNIPEIPANLLSDFLVLSAEVTSKPQETIITPIEANKHESTFPWEIEQYLKDHGIAVKNIKQEKDRIFYILGKCLFANDHTAKDSPGECSVVQGGEGKLTYQCFHAHCSDKTWTDAKKIISGSQSISQYNRENQYSRRVLLLIKLK